jgi:hypothetical protein
MREYDTCVVIRTQLFSQTYISEIDLYIIFLHSKQQLLAPQGGHREKAERSSTACDILDDCNGEIGEGGSQVCESYLSLL